MVGHTGNETRSSSADSERSSCEQYELFIDRKMSPPFTDMLKQGIVELYSKKDETNMIKEKSQI